MSAHAETTPVGGQIITRPFIILAGIFGLAMLAVAWRFIFGIGSISALSDAYPWGAWKPFSVIVLTAIASGGYAMAVLVYVLNRGQYHHLARTALLTSALGYTTGVMTLGIDIGRPWNFFRLAAVWEWNLHSVLLEVTVCITTYILFMWLELSPPFLEQWKSSSNLRLRQLSRTWLPRIERAFPWIVAMAVVLPTMHQSSLGALFMLAGPRVHPLWQTAMIPMLFLLSCYFLGFGAVTMTSLLSSAVWKRPFETRMLSQVMKVGGWVGLAFVALRLTDVAWRGQTGLLVLGDMFTWLFWAEVLLLGVPSALLVISGPIVDSGRLFRLAGVVLAGGGLYRLNTSLIAFMPGSQFGYFPSGLEMLVSAGFVALAILGYLVIVKRFPILPAATPVVGPTLRSGGIRS